MSRPYGRSSSPPPAVIGAGVVVFLAVLVLLFGVVFAGFSYTDAAKVGVVQNGGLLDNTDIRTTDGVPFVAPTPGHPGQGNPQIVPPGSSYKWVGLHSTVHEYPATARAWTFDQNPGADTNQTVNVQTRDGVTVGVKGQFTFALNQEPRVLADFDRRYGIRSYPSGDHNATPSDGSDEGWNAFLNQYLTNIVDNTMRQEIGQVTCRDLIASCSLVQNGNNGQVDPNINNTATLGAIQQKVDGEFGQVLNQQLGGNFFTGVSVSISKVELPGPLQDQVNQALGAFTQVSQSQAKVQQAQLDAQANAIKQQGYNTCSTCAQVDILHALPPGLLTYAPGGGAPIAVPAGR